MDVPVSDRHVEPAVEVGVTEQRAESQPTHARRPEPGRGAALLKTHPAGVEEQDVRLVLEVGHEQRRPAGAVHVAGIAMPIPAMNRGVGAQAQPLAAPTRRTARRPGCGTGRPAACRWPRRCPACPSPSRSVITTPSPGAAGAGGQPDDAVTSVKVPLPLLRNSRCARCREHEWAGTWCATGSTPRSQSG